MRSNRLLISLLLACVMPFCGCQSSGASAASDSAANTAEPPAPSAPQTDPDSAEPAVLSLRGGKTFSAAGGTFLPDGGLRFRKTVTLTADTPACGPYNRVTVSYSSDQPLIMTAVYRQSGVRVEDTLYLEAGQDLTFSFFIEGYLKNASADTLESLSFTPCTGQTAELRLSALTEERRAALSSDICTVSGRRYDVGIKLAWGGGICSVVDRENPVSGTENLINQHDTGRLIQQSYYGTGANGTYTPGFYNNSTWHYNPVQGGNQYNQPSRLIDLELSDTSVYIKCQPQDWSNRDYLTPSYMENTYTVFDDRILVENRFMDFSGWNHGMSTQEIPAFYTQSCFGTFVHYTGSADWTGDALTFERDLRFWGDSRYHADCEFPLRPAQTETWCAWVNESDDYGIGLYVPNCDLLLAGRYNYNGSRDPMNDATNYVAPLGCFSIGGFRPVTYSYLITTGSVGEIRRVFTAQRAFADNASLKEQYASLRTFETDYTDIVFDSPGMAGAFSRDVHNTAFAFDAGSGALRLTCLGDDPYAGICYDQNAVPLSADRYKTVSLTYRIPEGAGTDTSGELFLCAGDIAVPTAGYSLRFDGLLADGEWHTLTLDLSELSHWTGVIHEIRLDYFNSGTAGDSILIREIRLS